MQQSFKTYRERGKTEQEGLDGGEAQVPLSVPPQLPTNTTITPTHTDEEVGGGKQGGRTTENSVTLSLSDYYLYRSRLVILGGIANRMQGFKFNQYSAVYGNLNIHHTFQRCIFKSNYTMRHEHGKHGGPTSSTSSSATGPAHLERGQVIWKIQKERLTINIVGWHFSQLVWNRPSASTCGKAPAQRENSK